MDWTKTQHIPAVTHLMTPFPHAIEPSAPLSEAKAMMIENNIRHLPVRRGGELIGVISSRDLMRAQAYGVNSKVEDVAVSAPYLVEKDTTIDVVLRGMAARQISSALIVMNGKLVGIFTTTDACNHFAEALRALFQPPDQIA